VKSNESVTFCHFLLLSVTFCYFRVVNLFLTSNECNILNWGVTIRVAVRGPYLSVTRE
jgi:hypothetical protein